MVATECKLLIPEETCEKQVQTTPEVDDNSVFIYVILK